ncbi:MAG: type II toxin-antitoxin system HicA family toxin [Defluviitaleaceae bacterium]|nr:type II toxin-antitoxin system HicA family toxin [Defluviitaleaceae bacterium]
MSKKEKLIKRLKSKPNDMTFSEIETLLLSFGFRMSNKGKTSGSRIDFKLGNITVRLHKPHGNKPLLPYQIITILDSLITGGLI